MGRTAAALVYLPVVYSPRNGYSEMSSTLTGMLHYKKPSSRRRFFLPAPGIFPVFLPAGFPEAPSPGTGCDEALAGVTPIDLAPPPPLPPPDIPLSSGCDADNVTLRDGGGGIGLCCDPPKVPPPLPPLIDAPPMDPPLPSTVVRRAPPTAGVRTRGDTPVVGMSKAAAAAVAAAAVAAGLPPWRAGGTDDIGGAIPNGSGALASAVPATGAVVVILSPRSRAFHCSSSAASALAPTPP